MEGFVVVVVMGSTVAVFHSTLEATQNRALVFRNFRVRDTKTSEAKTFPAPVQEMPFGNVVRLSSLLFCTQLAAGRSSRAAPVVDALFAQILH